MKPKIFVALICGLFLAFATPALAANPGQSTYGGAGANQISTVQTSTGTLPFTGINLGAVSLIGVGLLGAGVVLRRRTGYSKN